MHSEKAARHMKAVATTSSTVKDDAMQFSRRTHGVLLPNRGTIRNARPKIGRNKLVSIQGTTSKMKHSAVYSLPVPAQVTK